jgi:hypothetical protein
MALSAFANLFGIKGFATCDASARGRAALPPIESRPSKRRQTAETADVRT